MKTVIEMAREAGLHIATDVNWMPIIGLKCAEKFAELVRADEREACAKVCDDLDAWNMDDPASTAVAAIRARSNT